MNDVLVERQLPEPLGEADMHTIAEEMGACLHLHRVTWCGSLLSADGQEMFCHFRAPDAESVRIAMRQSGAPPGRAWPCRVQDAPDLHDDDLARTSALVVHTFDRPSGFEGHQLDELVDMGCFQLHRVRLLRSFLSHDGLRLLAMYRAPDAESVRLAQRRAGLPAQRVLAVRRFAP